MSIWLNHSATSYNTLKHTSWSRPIFLTYDAMDDFAKKSATWDLSSALRGELEEWVRGAIAYPLDIDTLISLNICESTTRELYVGGDGLTYAIGATGVDGYSSLKSDKLFNLGSYEFNTFNYYTFFEPYSKYELYLPFYGYVSLKSTDISGKVITVYLAIEWTSGAGLYYITAGKSTVDESERRIIGQYSCQIGYPLPLGQSGALSAGRNMLMNAVKATALTAATVIAGDPTVTTEAASETVAAETARNAKTGRQVTLGTNRETSQVSTTRTSNSTRRNATSSVFNGAAQTLTSFQFSPQVDRANNPAVDMYGARYVHLITRRAVAKPMQSIGETRFESVYGKPLGQMRILDEIHGYTELGNVRIQGEAFSSATSEELAMLEDALSRPIILPDVIYIQFTLQAGGSTLIFSNANAGDTWQTYIDRGVFPERDYIDYTFYIENDKVYFSVTNEDGTANYVINVAEDKPVSPTDAIIDDFTYTLTAGGGGEPSVEGPLLFYNDDVEFTISSENLTYDGTLEYSTDNETWTTWDKSEISSVNGKLYLRGSGNTYVRGDADTGGFVITPYAYCAGSINALLGGDTPLTYRCYQSLFYKCTGLASTPELPATTLADSCYYGMFSGCTFLESAPELPATTLADGCYFSMFTGCRGLTSAPELPATTLADYCYSTMFSGCTGLTSAPELPATTLADYCYHRMFHKCSGIALSADMTDEYKTPYRIPTTGTGTTATNSLNEMFIGTGGSFTGTPTVNTTYYGAW